MMTTYHSTYYIIIISILSPEKKTIETVYEVTLSLHTAAVKKN